MRNLAKSSHTEFGYLDSVLVVSNGVVHFESPLQAPDDKPEVDVGYGQDDDQEQDDTTEEDDEEANKEDEHE